MAHKLSHRAASTNATVMTPFGWSKSTLNYVYFTIGALTPISMTKKTTKGRLNKKNLYLGFQVMTLDYIHTAWYLPRIYLTQISVS